MIRILLAIAAVVQVAGCSGIQVSQDYDPATGFGALRTFQWAADTQPQTGDPRIDNPLLDARVRTAIERVLTEKGVTRSHDDSSDLVIRYQYLLRQRLESSGTGAGFGFGFGHFGRRGGILVGTGDSVREVDEGELVIDFLDGQTDELLWRGTGTQRFKQYDDPAKTSRDINRLVETILAQFPPQP